MIPFGEWLPDQADFNNPGATIARNCTPAENSYKSLNDLTVYSGASTERVQQVFAAKDTGLNTYMFSGTATYLQKLATDTTWANVSLAGNYATPVDNTWEFTQYGDDVFAVNGDAYIQYYTLGVSTLFANRVSTIKAHHIASSPDFVMIGNTDDTTDGAVPHRIRWCAYRDPSDWTVAAATQADYQDMNSRYGEVRKVVYTGEFVVFQEYAITRLRYVGSPLVFDITDSETGKGTRIPGSVANVGDTIFYIGEDGFYAYNNGRSVPIGAGKVNKYFFTNMNVTYQNRIRTIVDPINTLVWWFYPSTTGAGLVDRQIIYNWTTNKWSEARYSVECAGMATSLGYTLEGLDAVSSSIDTLPFSLDSRAWKGGENSLVMFDSSHRMNYLTGSTLAAIVETTEFQAIPGRKANLRRIRPITDATCTAIVRTRNTQTATLTDSSAYSAVTDGSIPVRENSRYSRVQITTSGSFDHIQGIELEEVFPGGMR